MTKLFEFRPTSNNIVYDDVEKAEAFNTFFRLNQILMILTNQYQLTIRRH
jgi:hypothetical protein